MKVLHVTLSAGGGAGIACRRLHAALTRAGVESEILVALGEQGAGVHTAGRRSWRWRAHLDRLPLRRYRRRALFAWWSNNWLPGSLLERQAAARAPDLLHLHWIGDGWIAPAEVARTGLPVVWTLHDGWPFTGGCHYPGGCDRFTSGCGRCPQLGSADPRDLSARNLTRKRTAWARSRLSLVAPSRWLAHEARRSEALRAQPVDVIPNGLDPTVFAPGDRVVARKMFGLAEGDLALLAFCAGQAPELRKGAALIGPALAAVPAAIRRRIHLLVAGGGAPAELPPEVAVHALGQLREEAGLANAYRAADAHLLSSLQDNLPNTAVEAIACGCPVIAFGVGGVPEIVTPGRSGLLAARCDPEALAASVAAFAALSPENHALLRGGAREDFLRRFRSEDAASAYRALYERILAVRP